MMRFGLIGHGISRSLSPSIHHQLFKARGVDATYELIDVKSPEALSETLERCYRDGFEGLNVTTPYKKDVARLIGNSDGAINTLRRRSSGGWDATSTDGVGFESGLKRAGFLLTQFDRVVFLGAGGSVLSLLKYLHEHGVKPDISVLRRSDCHDEALRALGVTRFDQLTVESLRNEVARASSLTLMVQATSAPHHGDDLASLAEGVRGFKGFFCDLCYAPASQLLATHRASGGRGQDGLPMLEAQAGRSQDFWFEKITE